MACHYYYTFQNYNIMYSVEKCSYKLIENMSVAKENHSAVGWHLIIFVVSNNIKFLSTTDLI